MPGLHVELTSKCALACSKCSRTANPGKFVVTELPISTLTKLLRGSWERLLFSGVHGDPIYHSQFHRILECVRETAHPPPLFIESNGSGRSYDWWSRSARLLTANDIFSFSIDGLSDTNHLYRENANWSSIMTAVTTLRTESRCRLLWKFIVFRHNQHQVADAFSLARRWNMAFKLVDSARFEAEDPTRPTIPFAECERSILDQT
jgi:MoaA/NifB/PqqE/SkfB family radical SAM enzyme